MNDIKTIEELRACHEFIQYYNHKRDHSSIGNQPPMVFYKLAA